MPEIAVTRRFEAITRSGEGDPVALAAAAKRGDVQAACDLAALLTRAGWVEPRTIIAAYDQLMLEGYLSARRAAPPVVRDLPLRASPLPSSKGDLRTRLFARGNVMAAQPCRHGEPGATAFRTGLPDAGQFPFNTWSRLRTRRAKLARSDGGGADRHQDQGNDLCPSELGLGHRLDGLR